MRNESLFEMMVDQVAKLFLLLLLCIHDGDPVAELFLVYKNTLSHHGSIFLVSICLPVHI